MFWTGADVIVDCVGAPYWEKHSKCVALDGRVVHIGFVSQFYFIILHDHTHGGTGDFVSS